MSRVLTWDEFTAAREARLVGVFFWAVPNDRRSVTQLWLILPNGATTCVCVYPLPPGFQKRDASGTLRPSAWQWDGNADTPTLVPEMAHGKSGDPWHWHGCVTAGVMRGA
jgi:hypothetical protein